MSTESSLASTWLVFFRLLEVHGIDPHRLLREFGLDPQLVGRPGARLPSRMVDVITERACQLIDDPAFGLGAAACWHPSSLGVLGYAWLSSSSLHEGLNRLVRHSRLLGDRWRCRCVKEGGGVRFVYASGRGETRVGNALTDFGLSLFLDMCRSNFERKLDPVNVSLRRARPLDPSPYQDFFACELAFGADEDAFLLATEDAERLLPTANQELAATFDAILAEQLALHCDRDLVSRCQAFLLKQLTSGEPCVEALAKALGMSRRSLQRRLKEAGTSYQRVLEETRYELARRYLQDPVKSVTEITFLLGFSEQGAFTRAFKRWNGSAPRDYRLALAA